MKATHKGWILFCPIYLNMEDEECPTTWARHEWLEWLHSVATWCQFSMMGFLSMCNPDYEPMFALRITGECDVEAPPVDREF